MRGLSDRAADFLLQSGARRERLPEGVGWLEADSGLVVVDRGATLDVVGWGKGLVGPPVLSGASADEAGAYLVLHYGDGQPSWRTRCPFHWRTSSRPSSIQKGTRASLNTCGDDEGRPFGRWV